MDNPPQSASKSTLPEPRVEVRSGDTRTVTGADRSGGSAAPRAFSPGDVGDGLTHEDLDRARDRLAVERARRVGTHRSLLQRLRPLWLLVGPGILVFLSENDAPSMLSYAATGARYGIGFFLPFVLVTFLAAFVVQEMTVRLGAVTHRGHAELIFDRFGRFWGRFAMGDLMVGNFLTLVTEFIGIRAGLGFFGVPPLVAVGGAMLLVCGVILTPRYWTWERIALGLAAFNGLFVPAALLAHPQWGAVGHALLTWSPVPAEGLVTPNTILLIMSNIGAGVTPWMLFFQQSAVVDKGLQGGDIRAGRVDTLIGTLAAAVFGMAAIVATAPLAAHGINASDFEAAQFAEALQPLIGRVGATLFALGIFEAGLLAAITIATSSAYAFGEVLQTPHSLNRPLGEARSFYGVLVLSACAAGALVLIPHAPLTYIVLLVNVIAVLAMPPALLFLVLLVNDRELMGVHVNGWWANLGAITVTGLLILAGVVYGLVTVFPTLLGGR
ncbi:MAG: NRAMP family divalent metal transporter [Candidatus Methylomirabilales bacterium]